LNVLKDFLIVIKLTLTALFVAVFVYPVVHEGGHMLAVALTGGKIVCLSWFPVPNVLCEVGGMSAAALAAASLAGTVLPMLFVLPFLKTKGIVRFGALFFTLIVLLSGVIGTTVAVLRLFGVTVPNDDVTSFIGFTGCPLLALTVMLAVTLLSTGQIFLWKPKALFGGVLGLNQPLKPDYGSG
jgi:hypothetical protein